MRKATLSEITDVITKIAPSYPVISIDLFGSCAEHLENEKSDIDLLVYFDVRTATLFDLIGLKQDIENSFDRKWGVFYGIQNR
ncbi:MAG: nucleotidyltransferase domain-containing protein [Caldisericia bacterium]|nr:nucleotidyltransferase domain-containing protein [Caldisericia bacterium]